jgi:predicted nucleotidyltransferase
MADYRTESERFRERQEEAERDMKHAENLKVLSEHCHVPVEKVMEFLRPGARLIELLDDAGNVRVSSADFEGAPASLTDPELAEWAVRKISGG